MTTATISASEFKATCLQLFDRLVTRQLDRVEITKRGQVVAIMIPPEANSDWLRVFRESMAGSVTVPEGVDLTEPAFDGVMDAEIGILHR